MKKFILFFFVMTGFYTSAQSTLSIVPMPAEVKMGTGNFVLSSSTKIILQGSNLENIAGFLNGYLQKHAGFSLKITDKSTADNFIVLNYERMDRLLPGGYKMKINNKAVSISGDNEAGLFYGLQTLLQLISSPKKAMTSKNSYQAMIPQLSITDYPRFAYRGMHLDVARHFFSISFIKKYIDYLAAHKFNIFHWHLTDDQGWRIEINKYPLLTQVGGFRNGTIIGRYPGKGNDSLRYGGFYTQEQVKEVVKYAGERYIDVIPEIEMPGHASAAIAAYPQLSCFPEENTEILKSTAWAGSRTGKQVQQTWGVFKDVFVPTEYTFKFLEDVLDEVMPLFPSKYIHIGGDESPKENWKRSPFCQQLIKEKQLKDEHELQSYFIQRIEKYVNSKGKNIIGWDEILEGGIAPNATIMSWRGEEGGIIAAKQNHEVIMTPGTYCYLDHSQTKKEDSVTIGGYLPLEKVYGYEPVPTALNPKQAKYVLGAQGNVWTEYITNDKKVEYMIFPRLSALAEVLWSPKAKRNWKDFERRLPALIQLYKTWGTSYSRAYFALQTSVLPTPNFNGVLWKLDTKNKSKIIYVKGKSNNSSFNYAAPILVTSNAEYGAALTSNNNVIMDAWEWQKFEFNKATGKKITLNGSPSSNYPGSGGFTLVNGIITERKLEQSAEWLGFLGTNLDATIDLGKLEKINKIKLNILKQEGSWIYPPASVEFFTSDDGANFTSVGKQSNGVNEWTDDRQITVQLNNTSARYIKVMAINLGIIPQGNPGAGSPAWLFADEIEVE
ncbi:MAG: family 20 glycosylhydrolase [Ferruginibacter sp.]